LPLVTLRLQSGNYYRTRDMMKADLLKMVSCWVDDDSDELVMMMQLSMHCLFASIHPSLLYHQISNAKAYHIPLSEAVIDADGLLAEIERLFLDTI
jgi:hypothetical protein